jgi:hypothetical protein
MHRHGMDMTGLSMVRIRFGVNVEQGQGEQPKHYPSAQESSKPKTCSGETVSCRQHVVPTLS